MIKAIIFDIGGVIVSPEVEKITQRVSVYAGVDFESFNKYYEQYKSDLTKGKISLIDVYSEIVNHFKLTSLTGQNLVDEHLRLFREVIENLDEEVIALVENLKQKYEVFCLVNAEKDVVPLVRKRGIYSHFQKAYISTEMGMEKPDLEIYEAVLKDINFVPEETLFIDDKKPNVDAADKLGIHTILYKNYKDLKEELVNLKVDF